MDPCQDWDRDGRGVLCPLGDDCNDQDPNVWELVGAYPDSDGDFYYAGVLVGVCIGDNGLPLGYTPVYPAAPDCDDSNAGIFQMSTIYPDLDHDGSGSSSAGSYQCVGFNPPPGSVWFGGDCDDADPDAKPGQLGFFPDVRDNGTWDYDCDGTDEQQYPQACQQGSTSAGWVGLVPSCGNTGTFCTACLVNGGVGSNCSAGIPQPCQ